MVNIKYLRGQRKPMSVGGTKLYQRVKKGGRALCESLRHPVGGMSEDQGHFYIDFPLIDLFPF